MRLLVDNNPKRIAYLVERYGFIGGQLLTPLTRNSDSGLAYGIDNGAFSRFDERVWRSMIERQGRDALDRCLFVTLPDIVGEAQRTAELFMAFRHELSDWPVAMVAQDGAESIRIPWDHMSAVFIGGTTDWKMSRHAAGVIKTAKILGKYVHIGRVNTPVRWRHFDELGADTCDGSGVSRYDHMLDDIQRMLDTKDYHPLFSDRVGIDKTGHAGSGISPDGDGVLSYDGPVD